MSIVEFLSQPLWQRLGLTLVHFLWQGLAVAVLAGAFVRVFRLNHGNARYGAYLLAFIAMIACPVVTFTAIDISISPDIELVTGAESVEVVETFSYAALPAGDILPEVETSSPAIPTVADSIPLGQRISDWLNVSMPWILVIWMLGVIVLSVRLLMGFVGVYRWRHHLEPLPERLTQRIVSLSEGLGMRGFSGVFISPTVLQAMAVGYLRPMVLLPAAMITQMQPEMLEAVIAHELAHIRRFDLWVNLIQRVTETLLFYHPAVWWLSICLRSERELCCDELAVKATGQRLAYATTLESVGRARFMAKQPILAAGLGQDNKPTLSRVRHILGLTPTQRNCPFWLAGVIAVLFLAALVIPTTLALTNQSDEKLNDLESVVVEGIGANRNKFECGYLAWSSKHITTRFADSNRPATELAGEYELWWDGKKKIATKYVRDMVYTDPTGRFWVDKQQGGTSYDGSRLSIKPRFDGSENWLGPGVTRWSGQWSRDWLIRQASKLDHIIKDWSVIDVNGAKLIRCKSKNMNETARDYGAHSITDYDPSKGYGLVNKESYNPNGSPRLKHTVKMLEVIPGGWFPVEVDLKSFAITDGKVHSHNHYALDIERCSFNDKSALPDRIFKSAIDKQLKYQEKLQKYLAMELRGLSDVKEAAEADKVKRGAREAIEKFVAAALAGNLEKAGEYAHPDRLPPNHIADIPEVLKGQNLWIMAVVADDFDAIAVSSVIRGDHERIGPLVFFLDRKPEDGRDNWWVHDIDMETPDSAEVELKRFLEKHPKAQKVPYENKPAVQVEVQEKKDQKELSKFKKTLANGVTVELVGVCEHPVDANNKWWRPDGSLLPEAPFDDSGSQVYARGNERAYDFAVHYTNIPEDMYSIFYAEPLNSRVGGSLHSSVEKNGKTLQESQGGHLISTVSHVATVFDKNREKCIFKIGISDGPWETNFESIKPNENKRAWGSSGSSGSEGGVIFGKPIEQNQNTWITITDTIYSMVYEVRTVALHQNGSILKPIRVSNNSLGNTTQTTPCFDVPLKDISKFLVQTRKYKWVTFENVLLKPRKFHHVKFKSISLKPNFKTDVQVEGETGTKGAGENKWDVGGVVIKAVDNKAMLPNGVTVELVGVTKHYISSERPAKMRSF